MADNIEVTPGTGKTIAADEVGGALYQRVKVATGADGTATDWDGSTKDAGPIQTLSRKQVQSNDISVATEITDAPAAGQKIVAMDILISVDKDCYLTIEEETSAAVLAGMYVSGSAPVQITLRGMLKTLVADKKMMMKSSVAATKGACTCIYYSEA